MNEISSVAELEALPVGTRLLDGVDLEWVKLTNGRWDLAEPEQRGDSSEQLWKVFAPFVIVEPDSDPAAEHADAARDMARAEQMLEGQR